MGVANDERRELCDLFDQVGPDAPTLCGEWTTKDLAVHLVLRERRPDALAGKFVKALAERGDKVEQELREKPWPELIGTVREGAPKWNPLAIGAVDEAVNAAEFFVHHEDVRRARPGWQPRPADPEREEALWKSLGRVAKVFYGRSPVGVVLRRPDGTEIAAKRGPRTVRFSGESSELLLHAFGRKQSRVDIDGNDADVLAVEDLRRSF
ncbi:TIGR03085 family metal-binding protein [Saccharopolyspora sp. NPDC047091]|uniref:TIGR03085 family metal-binding protein n=1 Tax=Saccharopolyspora sp. NPDC047091 TaxID=3155924 RepID=UPI0033F928AA